MNTTATPVVPLTKPTRIPTDLAEMLSAIKFHDPTMDISDFLNPLIRKAIEKRFAAIPADIRARAEARFRAATTTA